MKRLLQLGFVLGLVGTLAAAYFFPWFGYTRYRSVAGVVTNGGRVEQFVVQLPADRIDADAGAATHPDAELQHFKLRDVEGNVIGVAARHVLTIGEADQTAWLLTIPSRGAIALASGPQENASIDAIVAASGLLPGESANQPLSIDNGVAAASIATTGEFSNIDLELVETWIVTGIEDDGGIRGTLELNTLARQTS